MRWKTVRLGDYCIKIGSGATPKGGATVYVADGVSLIRSQNIYNLSFEYDGLTHITDDAAAKLNGVTVFPNDILLNITGDSVARVCMVPMNVLPARVNQHVAIIRTTKDLLPQYLLYYLASPYMQAYMLNLAVGKGASRNALTKGMIEDFPLPLPSVEAQQRIVEILSPYSDLIENNQKQIKLLEEAAQRLYKEWFVDLRFPGYETTPIVEGVPKGWCVSSVGDCSCILRRGISPKYNEEGPSIVINQKCIRQSVVDLNEARRQEKSFDPEMNLNDSDTVICSTGAGTLGRVGQVFGQQTNTTFDSHVTLVRASNIVGKQYLYQFLKSKQQYLQGMGKGSTNQLELNRATIQELVLLIPRVKTQNAFECQAQPIHDQITVLTKQIVLLQEARDKLLTKLMSGELEV